MSSINSQNNNRGRPIYGTEFDSAITALQRNVCEDFSEQRRQRRERNSASEFCEGERCVGFTEMTRQMTALPNET